MNRTKLTKVIIGLLVIGGASAYLLVQALRSSLAYYYSVDEFVARAAKPLEGPRTADSGTRESRLIRLAGTVKPASTQKNPHDITLRFDLAGRQSSIPVTYSGPVPENFADGRDVVVEGRLSPEGVFVAQQIMTRCESKYQVKLDAGPSP